MFVFLFFLFLQLNVSMDRLPKMQALLRNLTARLGPYQYLLNMALYTDLSLQQLAQRIGSLEADVSSIHSQQGNSKTQKLVKEVNSGAVHNAISSLTAHLVT